MDDRRRKTVHAARRPEERPKDASHSSTFTECTAAMLTLPSFAGPTSARSVTRTVRMRFSVGTALSIVANGDITVAGRPPWDTLHPHRVVRPVGAVRKMSAPSFKNLKSTSARASRALSGSSRKSDTKCEVLLRSRLWRMGFRFRKNVRGLPGVPDIVFPRERVAIFCDGDFWHGRNWESRQEKLRCGANPDYWIAKISRNMERDVAQSAALRRSGWRVLRFWESRILKSPESVARRVGDVVRRRRSRL